MASLGQIRKAFKTTIEANIPGIKVYDRLPESAHVLPCICVYPIDIDFNGAFARGLDIHQFELIVLVSYNDLEVAQSNLDPFISGSGSKSIRACLWDNKTLGLENCNASISRMGDYGSRFQGAGVEHLGAKLYMTVHTKGDS
jgi:hypothetical protein